MDTLMVFFTLRNEAVFLKDSAGGPGAAIAGTRSDRQWSEHGRNGSGAATRAHEEASPLAAGRPQALNEDLSDCAEARPPAKQPVFAVAPGPQRGKAFGNREAGVAQPSAWGHLGSLQLSEAACVSAYRRGKNARAARGRGSKECPGANGRSVLQDPRQGSLTFDTRMRNAILYPLRPSLTSPDERGG